MSDERAHGEVVGMDSAEQAAADWEMEATRLRAELAASNQRADAALAQAAEMRRALERVRREAAAKAFKEASEWCGEWGTKRKGPGKTNSVSECLYEAAEAFENRAAELRKEWE